MRLLLAAAIVLGACGGRDEDGNALKVWFHTGKPAERACLERQVEAFNAQSEVQVELILIPEDGYHTQVEAQAAADELPDVLDFDGPYLASYVWKGYLVALDDLLPEATRADLLPSIRKQGEYRGRLYGVGTFDSGLGLYIDRAALRSAGVRVPEGTADAWTATEFDAALEQLRRRDEDGRVLDLKLNYRGEWYTYAFSPCLQSAGADLVARARPPRAQGTLDSAAATGALERIQGWIAGGFVDPNTDDRAFVDRRVALSWSGHWDYPRYREALGDDLAVVPLPDFGRGSRTGQGSWAWGITRDCKDRDAAARFLAFLLAKERVLEMTRANGAVPATRAAAAASPLYGARGPLRLFVEQLERSAVPRPVTPAYPVITDAFQRAFAAVRDARPVADALRAAARAIDAEIAENDGYR